MTGTRERGHVRTSVGGGAPVGFVGDDFADELLGGIRARIAVEGKLLGAVGGYLLPENTADRADPVKRAEWEHALRLTLEHVDANQRPEPFRHAPSRVRHFLTKEEAGELVYVLGELLVAFGRFRAVVRRYLAPSRAASRADPERRAKWERVLRLAVEGIEELDRERGTGLFAGGK